MGISPIYAIPRVLSQVGLTKEDVDIYEVRSLNSQTLYNYWIFSRSMKHSRRNSRTV